MLRVGIVGGTGKLGRDIAGLMPSRTDMKAGAIIGRKGNPLIGQDAGVLLGGGETGLRITDDIPASKEECDLYIDCTYAKALMEENLPAYALLNKPLIVATTGFSAEDLERLAGLAKSMPVAICPNFSIGVFKFLKLVRLAALEFGMHADIDITDIHHKMKKDQPSGTAKKIRDTILGTGVDAPVSLHSIRAGHVIGEHSVLFTTPENERIELSHKVYSREGFAQGVFTVIRWISRQQPGLYGLEDIFQ